MFLKSKNLNRWFWKWHIIGGLITLPIILLLCVSGIIYLFKTDYNNMAYEHILFVEPPVDYIKTVSYQEQLDKANASSNRHVMQVFLPKSEYHATGFRLHGKGHSRDILYINPYSGEITGEIKQKQTLMYKIRKLHGELLLDTPGTLIVELVASWFVVLIITGLYIWWPANNFSLASFFSVRRNRGRRVFWRDMHAVFGFWLSIFMLIILSGGMPWTDVFGSQLKWVQEKTQTGYPEHWRSTKGLSSELKGVDFFSDGLSLDEIVNLANQQNLKGKVTVKLPMEPQGVITVTNRSFWLRDQKVFHFDQYSGNLIKSYQWSDVGVLMEVRQIFMRLHQGEYGLANWIIVLLITLAFTVSTIGGLISYLIRKPKGRWGLPKTPAQFKVGRVLFFGILSLGVLFPMFGASLLVLWLYEKFTYLKQRKNILATP